MYFFPVRAKLRGTDSHCSNGRCQVQVWTPQLAADPDKQLPIRGLACTHFYFLAPAMLAKHWNKPSFFPRWGRINCNLRWPLSGTVPALSPEVKLSTAGISSCPLPTTGGHGHGQTCGFGDISFLGRSWELEGIHCASGTLQTAEWISL